MITKLYIDRRWFEIHFMNNLLHFYRKCETIYFRQVSSTATRIFIGVIACGMISVTLRLFVDVVVSLPELFVPRWDRVDNHERFRRWRDPAWHDSREVH